ncbi:hypothetical protein AAHB37_07620 [Glutamicibacter halophytocola]|uniref:hypothetical protein n=1 Tax=Glutamicibacter halophytocola TaxID=1933880 RepID=UPI00321C2E0F
MTGEYSSGTITSTLQAVPRRGIMVGSKAVVLGALGMATGLVLIPVATIPTALGAGQYGQFAFADLFSASLGAGTYLALLNLMVLGLGLLCRNSAGALVSLIALVLGLPQILQLIPMDWVQTLIQYLPTNAATFMATGATEPYGPAMSFVILVAWSAAAAGCWHGGLEKARRLGSHRLHRNSGPLQGSNFDMVVGMGSMSNAMQQGQRRIPPLALLQLALLVGAVFIGLLSMHVLMSPTTPSAAPMSSSGQGMIAHSLAHDSDMVPAGGDEGHGCEECPMDHEMSAAGCVLALLALLAVSASAGNSVTCQEAGDEPGGFDALPPAVPYVQAGPDGFGDLSNVMSWQAPCRMPAHFLCPLRAAL